MMAGVLPKQTVFIKDLTTRSVTFYPSKAHIVRDIENVVLKPGINEIEIFGLSPTLDEQSVQVDGKGAATIVDMTVELVPNLDVFDGEDEDSESSSDSDDACEGDDADAQLGKTTSEIDHLREQSTEQLQILESAHEQLDALGTYLQNVHPMSVTPEQLNKTLENHRVQRAELNRSVVTATKLRAAYEKELEKKTKEYDASRKEARKSLTRKRKLKAKEQRQKSLRRIEANKAVQFKRDERQKFWPKMVYRILLQLETNSQCTPLPSRRQPIDSVTVAECPTPSIRDAADTKLEGRTPDDATISLSLFYATREAWWTPRYAIDISSVRKTALIECRAEFNNMTSETWKDTALSFSTSQTSYQGLDEVLPELHPWHVKLAKGNGTDERSGLLSVEELSKPRGGRQAAAPVFARHLFFGMDTYHAPHPKNQMPLPQQLPQMRGPNMNMMQQQQQQQLVQQAQQAQQQQMQQQAFQAVPGSNPQAQRGKQALLDYQMQQVLLGQQNKNRLLMAGQAQQQQQQRERERDMSDGSGNATSFGDGGLEHFAFDTFCVKDGEVQESLAFSESVWEEHGLTETYDVAPQQHRTIAPSSQTRRHRIAALRVANIDLSHIAVPKLRSAIFLLASLRNPSPNMTLLKGTAGVTLDGSYLGSMAMPRVGPSQMFQLSLGIDPAVHISYPKPEVRRTTQGLFTKENAQVYTRNMWLTNTKKVAVDLIVKEQVPVSEEEKLTVNVLHPAGLNKEGDAVATGDSARDVSAGNKVSETGKGSSKKAANWGSAIARLKKNGEIAFAVKLEPSGGCLLKLEYEARLPSTDRIVSV